jgi:hypothetical protein
MGAFFLVIVVSSSIGTVWFFRYDLGDDGEPRDKALLPW